MKELLVRASSGAVYVALVLGAAYLGPIATAVLFLPIAVISAQEWHRLRWRHVSAGPSPLASMFIGAVAYAAWAMGGSGWGTEFHVSGERNIIAGLLIMALVASIVLFRAAVKRTTQHTRRMSEPALHLTTISLGIAVPMGCATWLTARDSMLFIGFMLLLWTNDTGAYLVGKAIGRTKLIPKVSPGKTWEGLIGGIALTMLVAWAWSDLSPALSPMGWFIAGAAVSITATAGDLFESALKRAAGVKDSGAIMPGHGGALDRFDGYLLAAPTMLLVQVLIGT